MAPAGIEHHHEQEHRATLRLVSGGSIVEAVGGTGAVVLAILGLTGISPELLASIAALALGAALLSEGGALAARFSNLLAEAAPRRVEQEIGGGLSAELLGGAAGVALGILALLGVSTMTLLAVSAIVFGASLLVGSAATAGVDALMLGVPDDRTRQLAHEAVRGASGAQLMVGLGAVALGILALLGIDPLTLVLAAMLAVGASVLLTGSVLGGRLMSAIRH